MEIKPPYAPFFNRGHLVIDEFGRRRILLYSTVAPGTKLTTSYARYLYNCHLYEKDGTYVPNDLYVDHINNDCSDDRVENFQLLTHRQNLMKKQNLEYGKLPLSLEMRAEIDTYLASGWPRHEIADKLNISHGFLAYIIDVFLPHHINEKQLELNVEGIRHMLDKGYSKLHIAGEYGVKEKAIIDFTKKHFPETVRATKTEETAEVIRKMFFEDKKTTKDIVKELGLTVATVRNYLRVHCKDEYIEWMKKNLPNRIDTTGPKDWELPIIEAIKAGESLNSIAKKFNVAWSAVQRIGLRYVN